VSDRRHFQRTATGLVQASMQGTELFRWTAENSLNPGFMCVYLMGFLGVIFAVITQIRINVMNLYSGSLALSNGFDVAAHLRPGRQWWTFLVWFFGVVFYATNVINYLGTFLAIAGVLTNNGCSSSSPTTSSADTGCGWGVWKGSSYARTRSARGTRSVSFPWVWRSPSGRWA
jgi:hypothetical protein